MESAYDDNNWQYAWDSTSLGRLYVCPRLYFYQNVIGYQPKEQSIHLWFGILAHKALETFDWLKAKGADHEEALHKTVRWLHSQTWDYKSDNPYKNKVTLMRLVVWYLETFRDDALKTVIFEDGTPAVELSFRFELSNNILICGHLDKLVTMGDDTYTKDLKTTKSALGQMYFDQYSPDIQMPIYTMGGQIVYKVPVKGVIIDAAQIMVNGVRFMRAPVTYGKAWLEEFSRSILHNIELARAFHEAKFWPMNPKSCHKYGGCDFRKVCSRSPEVRHLFLEADFTIERWDPLKVRGDVL